MGVRTLARKIDPVRLETVRRSLHKYLSGDAVPHRPMRVAIADALGVDREEFLADDDAEEDA